jgi:hypothetical protein
MASKPKLRLGKNGLTATETLDLFGDLPDGAALAAASDTWGDDYGEFIAALAEQDYGEFIAALAKGGVKRKGPEGWGFFRAGGVWRLRGRNQH